MPYIPPPRLAFWESRLPYVSGQAIETTFVAGTGYGLDYEVHYDPIWGFHRAQDYSVAKGLAVTDWSNPIAAAIVRYRDRAVRAVDGGEETPGVQPWHVFSSGIVRHHAETSDLADVEAIGYLVASTGAGSSDVKIREDYGHIGVPRELAEMLQLLLDREAMGLGEHARVDACAECALGHVARWTETPKRAFIWLNPFMGALTARALVTYWTRYRNSVDATKSAIVAQIPPALRAFCDYVWSDCWYPAGTPVAIDPSNTWDKGALQYMDVGFADPTMQPITGLAVVTVDPSEPRRVFTGPSSLSAVDDHYAGCAIAFDGIADRFLCIGYVGATREFRLTTTYTVQNRDITTADTFAVEPSTANRDPTEGTAASPDLNDMLWPAFFWTYWYLRTVEGDAASAEVYRTRGHEMFDGSYHSWNDPFAQKQDNQKKYWSFDGLGWLQSADEFEPGIDPNPAPGSRVLLIAAAGGTTLLISTP